MIAPTRSAMFCDCEPLDRGRVLPKMARRFNRFRTPRCAGTRAVATVRPACPHDRRFPVGQDGQDQLPQLDTAPARHAVALQSERKEFSDQIDRITAEIERNIKRKPTIRRPGSR